MNLSLSPSSPSSPPSPPPSTALHLPLLHRRQRLLRRPAIVVGIFVLLFYSGLRQHGTLGALENDVAAAVVEAERTRMGGRRVESWRNREYPDPWVAEVLRRNDEDRMGDGMGGMDLVQGTGEREK